MKTHTIFGLHKKTVDFHLQKMKKAFDKEEDELHYQLKQLQRENDEMELSIQSFEEKAATTTEERLLYVAHERTPLIIEWLEKQQDEEVKKLRSDYEKDVAVLEGKIQSLDKEIETATSLLQSMINQYTSVIGNLNSNMSIEQVMQNNQASPFITLALNQTAAAIEAEAVLGSEEDKNNPINATGNSFWEGAEFYQNKWVESTEKRIGISQSIEKINTNNTNPKIQKDQELNQVNLDERIDSQVKPEPQESQGIKQEIDQIKNRYIIGKIAGSDLYDQKGQLIVRKSEEITSEIIEHAKQAGLLSNLIVNMKIPGLGDSLNE